ncbi:porin [Simiduia curdlanivorans]|uniref:Porin n=1 Tax=Simiduia curdlanivorans TaxID=1492769 RepID=A0ABV8V1C9_9GAMM|nr:porin [Simiduia curdlanivorans]MDN3637466.1 porin [Simiduia curdlanivorans]
MSFKALALLTLSCAVGVVVADDQPNIELSGFGTLTAISSSSDIYGFRPDLSYDGGSTQGELEFRSASLLGGQMDYKATHALSFTAQGMLRDRAENAFNEIVSQFFVKYSANPGLHVRAGRLPLDLFALTEYRDITYAYPWALAPTEVYGVVPNRYLDGLDVSYIKPLNDSAITVKLFAGLSETIVASPGSVDVTKLKDIVGLSVDWSTLDWYLKLRHTQGVFENNSENVQAFLAQLETIPAAIWPKGSDFIEAYSFENKRIHYTSASAQYALNRWLLSGEYALIKSDAAAVERIEGGYASLTYRIDDWAAYLLLGYTDSNTYSYDETITVPPEFFPNYDEFVDALTAAMHAFSPNQNSVSIGARYDVTDSVALKLQWTKTDIDERGGVLWSRTTGEYSADKVDTVIFSLSFIF